MNFGSLTEVGFYIQHLIGISYSLIHMLIFPIACKVATIDRGLEPSTLQRLDKSQALRVYRLYYYPRRFMSIWGFIVSAIPFECAAMSKAHWESEVDLVICLYCEKVW